VHPAPGQVRRGGNSAQAGADDDDGSVFHRLSSRNAFQGVRNAGILRRAQDASPDMG
jgi:hypothetical protein